MAKTKQAEKSLPEALEVDLPIFEGPFDLLLDLIEEHELDIFDIPISLITREYLEYIETLESLNLEIGAEWLEMAARLTYIKSQMLLPDREDDDEDELDPREKLAWQLVQHKKYQLIIDKLDELPRLERDVFVHPGREMEFRRQTGPPEVKNSDIGALRGAIANLLKSDKVEQQETFTISRIDLTVADVIEDVSGRLEDKEGIYFRALFEHNISRPRVIIGFLALLEMAKLDLVGFERPTDGELFIRRRVDDFSNIDDRQLGVGSWESEVGSWE